MEDDEIILDDNIDTDELNLEQEEIKINDDDNYNDEEIELSPPNENKAKKLNVSNIFLIIIIIFVLIFCIISFISFLSEKKDAEINELDKAGEKYIPDFDIEKKSDIQKEIDKVIEDKQDEVVNKNVDEILNDLPEEFQPPKPGVAPINTNTSAVVSTRPDTRNSVSIRKLEGLANNDNYMIEQTNKKMIADNMKSYNTTNPNYKFENPNYQSSPQTKEDYVKNILGQTSNVNYNQSNQQSYQTNKESFYNTKGNNAAMGEYLSYSSLWDGTIITGALMTEINTDNPGIVIARVTENVYSSYDSSFLLIPEGSLLYATYNSSVSYGQNRVQIAWNLLIRPDGYRLQLGNMNGVDKTGASGTKGIVSNHPFETLKALGLVAIFSVIQTEVNKTIDTANNDYAQNALTEVYNEASNLGNRILERALDIKPTIKIKQGTEIKLITNTPLEMPPVKVNPVTRKYIKIK